MFGIRVSSKKRTKDEGEKPFWISFSDLMSALMVLFLVSMAVALIAITQKQKDNDETSGLRANDIKECLAEMDGVIKRPGFEGVRLNNNVIDFGTVVEFGNNSHQFKNISVDEKFIRKFVPEILKKSQLRSCNKWLKRVVVEGFASRTGNYLYNLNLSYQRSQRVLCTLLNTQASDALIENDRKLIQTMFLVGGSSFNTKENDDPSRMRRVEMKLEFYELLEKPQQSNDIPLDPGLNCPNDIAAAFPVVNM